MNTARIVVLVISIAAGALAIWLLNSPEPQQAVQAPPVQIDTVDVLVAKSDIGLGQTVTADDLQWQTWPAANTSASYVRRSDRPEALTQIAGSIARSSFIAGEPIREMKLVKGPSSGIMAAILPSGMRAVSTEISLESGASGFILPNDHVDVILSRREKAVQSASNANAPPQDRVVSVIILSNIRVLAIDQTIEEKNGQKVVVGKTATLELKPEQTELITAARQAGSLTLALRSIADLNAKSSSLQRGPSNVVTVYRGIEREAYACTPLCRVAPEGSGGGGGTPN